MTIPVKFNTGGQVVFFGGFKSSSDAVTDMVSLVISAGNIKFQKANSIALSSHSLSGATHVASGKYMVTLGVGDTDVYGPMKAWIDVTGALSERMELLIMEANAYDAQLAALGTGYIEAEVKTKTGFSLAATGLDAIVSTATGMVEIAKAIWDRVLTGATHNIATSAGRRLRQLASNVYSDGTAQAGGVNTITLAAGENATDDIYWQSYIAIVGGTGAGQGHHVIAYNGTTKVAVMDDDWVVQPDATSEYVIFGAGSHDEIMSGLARAGSSNTLTLEAVAHGGDDLIKDCYIVVLSGTGAHQARLITAYDGTTKVATVSPDWVVNPDATSGYWIIPQGQNNVWDLILTGALHNVADSSGRRLRNLQEFGTYEGGAVWIDTVNGTAGTTDYESGTVFNPVDSIADAITIATSLKLKIFHIITGSTITFAATLNNFFFRGHGWTLALGGQDIGGTHVEGPASVSGIGTGATEVEFHQCEIGAITVNKTHFDRCGFEGTVILAEAASYELEKCYSDNDNTLILDFGAGVGNTTVNLSGWNGKVELQNMGQTGTDVANIQGCGEVAINANCTGGTVTLCGNLTLTDNGSGQTINDDARVDAAQINTEVDNALDTALPASPTTGSINDILDRQEELIVGGAAATGTLSTTEMTTDLTISVADQYNGRILTFRKDTTTAALRGQQTDITATTILNGKLGFTALTTAPADGDVFDIT